MSQTAIDDIEERLTDLSEALREGGYAEVAERFEAHALDFTEPTRVRRAVNAIAAELERWRLDPEHAPESPKAIVAGNRLEDVCRQALHSGVIAAAPPSVGSRVRRKAAIALFTLLAGSLALLIPIALTRAGIDFSDLEHVRRLPVLRLPRGEEATRALTLLTAALEPKAVTAVRIGVRGGCNDALAGGATCGKVEPRLWPPGRIDTYELKLPRQAYGLLFSIDQQRLLGGGVGGGRLWLAATDDTPEGHYELELVGSYHGYTPQACDLLARLQNTCPKPRVGPGEQHTGVALATVVVDVVPGDPSKRLGEKRLAEAEAAEKRKQAKERAQQIESALGEIDAVLKETEKLLARKRWEELRERVQKLSALFAPIEALTRGAADAVPPEVNQARARLDALRDGLRGFEDRVFEQTFDTLTAARNRSVPEDRLLAQIAKKNHISAQYVEDVYTERADEIQRRLDAREQARMDALKAEQAAREKRCGPLPMDAWQLVERYAKAELSQLRVEIVLGECLTARLTEHDCWEMRCDYERREEVAIERPRVVTKHSATFYLAQGRVVRHRMQ